MYNTPTFRDKFRTVCVYFKRHYILSALAVLFLVLVASYLKEIRSQVTKIEAFKGAGFDFHAPSSDFFVKPVPAGLINQDENLQDENEMRYNPPGRRLADVARAPEHLARAAKHQHEPAPKLNSFQPRNRLHNVQTQDPNHIKKILDEKYDVKRDEPKNNKVKESGDEKNEPTFAAKMIIASKERQRSRRYEFKDVPDTVYKTVHDITHLCPEGDPPIKFSKWFNSFCWFENNCGCKEEPSMIRCLPKFHLIGFPKAGTTDLFRRLMNHPQVLDTKKETNYWSVTRFIELGNETELLRGNDTMALFTEDNIVNLENASVITKGIEPYLDFYNRAMQEIEREFQTHGERNPSKLVLGEGSVTYAYSSLGLRISIGNILNISPMEVDCTIPRIIRYITPDAKIIVQLRNPVERLYSDYRNLFISLAAENKTAADFHKRVVNRISMWEKCVAEKSEEYCINSPQFEAVAVHSAIIGLVRSIYVLHLQKWMKEFPRKQIYTVHFEERVANASRIMGDILNFLELEPLPSDKLYQLAHKHIPIYESVNARPHQAGYGKEPMWESTRRILEDFYRPYNKRLAILLDDEKYLWYDSTKQFEVPKKKYNNHD